MKMFLIFLLRILLLLMTTNSYATNPRLLDKGDIIYKGSLIFGAFETVKVQVVRIDVGANKVKVRDLETGEVEWVKSENLYTKDEMYRKRRQGLIQGINDLKKGSIYAIGDSCKKDQAFINAEPNTTKLNVFCDCFAHSIVTRENPIKTADIVINFKLANLNFLGADFLDVHLWNCAQDVSGKFMFQVVTVFQHFKDKPVGKKRIANIDEKMFYLTRKSAYKNHAPAQYMLGLMYREGVGTRRDNDKAWLWIKKAADQGIPEAKAMMKRKHPIKNCIMTEKGCSAF